MKTDNQEEVVVAVLYLFFSVFVFLRVRFLEGDFCREFERASVGSRDRRESEGKRNLACETEGVAVDQVYVVKFRRRL